MSNVYQDKSAQLKYRCLSILPFSSFLSAITLGTYICFRIRCMLAADSGITDAGASAIAWLYLFIEFSFLAPGFFNHILRCLASQGSASKAPRLRLQGEKPPMIDVFITCAGEDTDTILNTTKAACASDYPPDRFRVIVLDDAGSAEVSSLVNSLRKTKSNVYYTARIKGEDHHFKAGNLNHGYDFVKALPGGPAGFIAGLDADMIADPAWLRALLPHLLADPKVALAQCPQAFYDVPRGDPLSQGLDVNYQITEPMKDKVASTWCGGTGYVIRRSALKTIGGFPTDSVGEDMYCSNVLLGKGWSAVYVDESLQHGRVPESYKAHVKQQSRWHVGRIQSAVAMGFYVWGPRCRMMSVKQRIIGLIYVIHSIGNIFMTLSILALPLVLLSGQALVTYSGKDDLRLLLWFAFAFTLSEWLEDCIVARVVSYSIAVAETHATYWISTYHTTALVKAFSPNWFQGKAFQFSASGSGDGSVNERNAGDNPLSHRLRAALWTNKIGFHIVYVLICAVCLVSSVSRVLSRQHEGTTTLLVDLLVHLGWPPVLWLVCLNSFSVPIQYAFNPPTALSDAKLLQHDPVSGATYPKQRRKDHYRTPQSLVHTGVFAYNLALFLWTLNF